MIYKVQSNFAGLIEAGFFNPSTGEVDVSIVSSSSTKIVVENLFTGITTEMIGTGLSLSPTGSPLGGTITSFKLYSSTAPFGEVTDISWGLIAFDQSLAGIESDDETRLVALINQNPITFDLREATGPIDLESLLENVVTRITQPMTIYDSQYEDVIVGGSGNDTIYFTGNIDGEYFYDSYEATLGNDKLIFTGASSTDFVALDFDLDYQGGVTPLSVLIDGAANTGTISSTSFTDTLVDPDAIMTADGMTIIGTFLNDTFNATVGAEQFLGLEGAEGNDSFTLDVAEGGTVRLDFRTAQSGAASTGVNLNMVTGVIQDGFGGTDSLSKTGGGRFEVRGSYADDVFIGSTGDERFITERGDDSIDGGGGYDVLRYNRSGVDGLDINVATGTVTGAWNGEAFTDTFANIDEIVGSRVNDVMTGSAERDILIGHSGNDTIYGGDGDDRLDGGNDDDVIYDGAGNDDVLGWWGNDTAFLHGSEEYDYVDLHAGIDVIDVSNHIGGYLTVNHWDLLEDNAFTVNVNSVGNFADVIKGSGNGITSITDVNKLMLNDSLRIQGSQLDDVFNVNVIEDGRISVRGGRGDDTYNLTGSAGQVVIDYRDDNRFDDPLSGIVVNMQTGVVSNDGFGGTDTIIGLGDGEIAIVGTLHADTYTGSDRDDGFVGLGGNDVADGGDGIDVLEVGYGDTSAGAIVDLGAGTAKGEYRGVAFTKTVTNFEDVYGSSFGDIIIGDDESNEFVGKNGDDFLFGDGIQISSASTISGQIYRLYQATLGREADTGGHAGWTTLLFTGQLELSDAASGFVNSGEFQNVYGDLDNAEFVELLYQNVLGRSAAQAEIDAWLVNFDAGQTRAQVVTGFSEGREFKNKTAADSNLFTVERTAAEWSDEIYRLYQATLAREPDEGSFKGWAEALSSGTELSAAAGGFVNSREFQNVYGSLTDGEFVDRLYQNVLGRGASQTEIDGWLDVINGGSSRADVVLGFSQSREFRNNTAEDLVNWVREQGEDDVLIGENGDNHLMGGLMSDTFVFRPNTEGTTTVYDFEAWDGLAMQNFAVSTKQELLDEMVQVGADVTFDFDGTSFVLLNTQLSDLSESNIYL